MTGDGGPGAGADSQPWVHQLWSSPTSRTTDRRDEVAPRCFPATEAAGADAEAGR